MFNISRVLNKYKNLLIKQRFLFFLNYSLNKTKELFYIFYLIKKLKKLNKNYSLKSLVEFSFHCHEGLISPRQSKFEILKLIQKLKKLKPKFLLEIGTASGGSLFLFTRIASKSALIISIDLPHGRHGGGYPRWKIPLYKSFVLPSQKMFLIRADSHDINTLQKVLEILNKNKLDFLFIDGDHSYEGVKKDFEFYSPLVKKDGIITFHDIYNTIDEFFEVYKFWKEIRSNYNYEEIIEDRNLKGIGIGIIEFK